MSISLFILPIYLIITYLLLGRLPSSISETYYMYLEKYGIKWPFKVVLLLLVASMMPKWFELSDSINSNITFLTFLSCVSLIGVAIKANYLYGDKKYHYSFTCIAFLLSLLWTILIGNWIIPVILYTIALFVSFSAFLFQKGTFEYRITNARIMLWFELAAFYTIQISLI